MRGCLRWADMLGKLLSFVMLRRLCVFTIASLVLASHAVSATPSKEFLEAERAYSAGDTDKAFSIWKKLSDEGDLDSQYYLATLYLMIDIPSSEFLRLSELGLNPQEFAIPLIEDAAEKNHSDSLTMMASFYESGFADFEINAALAMKYREKAAATGDALAIYNLADILFRRGDKTSKERAYDLYHTAAKKRFVLAFYPMGYIHFQRQTPEDLVMAYAWFQAILDWKPTDDVQGVVGQFETLKSNAEIAMGEIEKTITPDQVVMAKLVALGLFEE